PTPPHPTSATRNIAPPPMRLSFAAPRRAASPASPPSRSSPRRSVYGDRADGASPRPQPRRRVAARPPGRPPRSRRSSSRRQRGLDALLVTPPSNRFYLSGFTGTDIPPNESAGCLLIADETSYLVTGPVNVEQGRAQATGFEVVPRGKDLPATLAELLGKHGV